jgi:hypothetical protein
MSASCLLPDFRRKSIVRQSDDSKEQILGTGYELERSQEITIDGVTQTWTERVLLIRSQSYLETQKRGLLARLNKAQEQLLALTPPVGRGKRQIRDELEVCQKAEQICQSHRVEGLLNYDYEYEVPTRHTLGRYQITSVTLNPRVNLWTSYQTLESMQKRQRSIPNLLKGDKKLCQPYEMKSLACWISVRSRSHQRFSHDRRSFQAIV